MVTMAMEGTDVWAAIKHNLKAAKTDLAGCQQAAAQLDAQMREILDRRGQALALLARLYLPEISKPAIESTFGSIRNDLLRILAAKESRQRDLQRQVNTTEEETQRRGGELDQLTKTLNLKVSERERLEAQVAETLKGNDDFQERSKLALEAEEQLHKNEGRVTEIQHEAAEKLPNYEKSRLFKYLYERGFGTPDYKATGWSKDIDTWVARLIDFGNARIGYEYLKKTPGLVAQEVTRRQERFSQLMQQVEAIQHSEAEHAGLLNAVLEAGEALGDKRDLLVQDIERLRKQSQGLQQELARLEKTQNEFYAEAVERFRVFLGETKQAILKQRAQETPEPEDDAIVSELADLNRQNEDMTRQLNDISQRRQAADRVQEGLDLVAQRYRQANYDSQRCYFRQGFDFDRLFGQFRDGTIDSDSFWRAIQASQEFRPHWVESTVHQGGA